MKKSGIGHKILRGIYSYFLFFLLVAFLVTCTTMLFVSVLSQNLGVELNDENVQLAAKLTFLNVIVLSVIFFIIDVIRRKVTTEKITNRITASAKRLVSGDFGVRLSPVSEFSADENYNEIIACFNKMAEELSSVETLRTDFISNVSHEMKTPLAIMQNYGRLLSAEELSDEKRIEYAKEITESSRRLADMMTNILKLNRLENQKIYPKSERYNLTEQLCECLLQYESVWDKSGIEINTDIEEDVFISADSELLSLVWNNLLSNAFKFTRPGGKVTLSLKTDGEFALVGVSDTGIGMSSEVGAHIFEKFYQGDTSHATSGNGLGLALVKRVIDIMQYDVAVESAVGVGTTFTVKIRRCGNELEVAG